MATKRRFQNLVEVRRPAARADRDAPSPATREQLLAVHTAEYVARIDELSAARGGDAGDGTTPFGRGGFEIARLAASGAVCAVEAVVRGAVDNVYALVRPPGHHALPDRGMVVVASGLDANAFDPMGRMLLHSDTFRELTEMLLAFGEDRIVVIHEGGYSEFYVPFCVLAVVEAMAGRRTPVEDPCLEEVRVMAGQKLSDHQREAIDAAEALVVRATG